MIYLFPPEQLRAVRIKEKSEWIIFHRESSLHRIETLTGPTDRIQVAGLAAAKSPVFELFDIKCEATPGFFEFKTSAVETAPVEIVSERALRIIQSGVCLGESYAQRKKVGHLIATGGNLDMLMQRTLCWLLWPTFTDKKFLKRCERLNTLPLHQAAEVISKTGNKGLNGEQLTADALGKHFKRLGLPVPRA